MITLFRPLVFFFFFTLVSGLSLQGIAAEEAPVLDSKMTEQEAFEGLDPNCPEEIRAQQKIVTVRYLGFDKRIHQGQLVVDRDLEEDLQRVFDIARQEGFPLFSVIPAADKRFRKDERWSDDLSMEANNSSAFNYRLSTGGKQLSKHAYGRAIDINPMQNPYVKGNLVLPPGAGYNANAAGTLTADHPLVREFLRLGWEWGGNWTSLKDYQHFEKPLEKK